MNGSGTNGHAAVTSKSEMPFGYLDDKIREAVQDEIDKQVSERVSAMWEKGRKAMSQTSAKHDKQLTELAAEVGRCQERQKELESENTELKKVLTQLADRFRQLGTVFSGPGQAGEIPVESAWGASCPPPNGLPPPPPKKDKDSPVHSASRGEPTQAEKWLLDTVTRKSSWVNNDGDASSSASTATPLNHPATGLADLLDSCPASASSRSSQGIAADCPNVPPYLEPYPKDTEAKVSVNAAPLSLADALGPPLGAGSAAPTPSSVAPTPLSLATSLPPASPSLPPGLEAAVSMTPGVSLPNLANMPAEMFSMLNAAAIAGQRGYTTFSFTLRRADDVELGLTVSPTDDNKALRVEAIREDGAVESWNRQCVTNLNPFALQGPDNKTVKPGDMIVGVNSSSLDADAMLGQCKDKALLKITILRGPMGMEEAALMALYEQGQASGDSAAGASGASSTMRAEAAAFVPMGGPLPEGTTKEAAEADKPPSPVLVPKAA